MEALEEYNKKEIVDFTALPAPITADYICGDMPLRNNKFALIKNEFESKRTDLRDILVKDIKNFKISNFGIYEQFVFLV